MQNTTGLQRSNDQPLGPSRFWLSIIALLNLAIFGAFVLDFVR